MGEASPAPRLPRPTQWWRCSCTARIPPESLQMACSSPGSWGDHPEKRRSSVFHGAMNFGKEKHQTSPNETRMIVALLWLWKPNVQKTKRNSLKAPSPSSYHLPQLQLLQNSALSCRFQSHHEHFHLRWAVDFVAHPGQVIPELRDSISHGSQHGRSRWQSTTLASFPKNKALKKSQVTSLVLFFHHTSSNAALLFLEIDKMVRWGTYRIWRNGYDPCSSIAQWRGNVG